jgi:hypothetical protein
MFRFMMFEVNEGLEGFMGWGAGFWFGLVYRGFSRSI